LIRLSVKRQQACVDQITHVFEKTKPVLEKLQQLAFAIAPYIFLAITYLKSIWLTLQPYHPQEFAPALFGLVMAFFGGIYFTTFAAFEAYRVCGWKKSVECIKTLYNDCLIVYEAHLHDNELDEDDNGIPDVLEITPKELAMRKINLILTTVDPMQVAEAVQGISVGFAGVVASLRVEFAQTIMIGVTLGDILRKVVEPIAAPALDVVIPLKYKRWIPVIIIYGSKTFGVSLAWMVQRVISAFYSAIRGAEIFARGLTHYLERRGYDTGPVEGDSVLYGLLVFAIATAGFITQLLWRFSLPFPLNFFFFPLTVVEWLLMWFVGVK